MSNRNDVTNDIITTKPVKQFDNYDLIFRTPVNYTFIYKDGFQMTREFKSQHEADKFIESNQTFIDTYIKLAVLLG